MSRSTRDPPHDCFFDHICDLDLPEHLKPLVWYQKLRMNYFLVSEKSLQARAYFRSHAAIRREKRRQFNHYVFTIHPYSLFRMRWDCVMMVVYIAALVVFPLHFAVPPCLTPDKRALIITEKTIEIVCCLDIIFNCLTGFAREFGCVLDVTSIILNYVLSGLLVTDCMASLPINSMRGRCDLFREKLNYWPLVIHMMKSTYLFRLPTVNRTSKMFLRQMGTDWISLQMVKLTIMFLLSIHWMTCAQYLLVYFNHGCDPEPSETALWMTKHNLWQKSWTHRYVVGFYRSGRRIFYFNYGQWELMFIQSSGYKVSESDEIQADYYTITIWLLSFSFHVLFKATSLVILSRKRSSKIKYISMMNGVEHYLKTKGFPQNLRDRVHQYYNVKYLDCYFDEEEILDCVTPRLHREMVVESAREMLTKVPFLSMLPQHLLTRLATTVTMEIYLPNDVIVRVHTPGDRMFVIASGTVAVYSVTGNEICHLEDGEYFGEIALVEGYGGVRTASVVAVSRCVVGSIGRAALLSAMSAHGARGARRQLEREATRRASVVEFEDDRQRVIAVHKAKRNLQKMDATLFGY